MNTFTISTLRRLAIVALTAVLGLSFATFVNATPPPGAKKEAQATLAETSAEAGYLRQAYAALALADHDYKGHRAAAMKEVEAAAKRLGVELKGDGHVREAQRTSDDQLRYAEGLLAQITVAVKGEGLNHIKLALKQLNTALAIK